MRFIVESSLAVAPTPEIMALLPAETARGMELEAAGIREKLYVSADYARAWQVFVVDSREALDAALMSLPMHQYGTHNINQLADQ